MQLYPAIDLCNGHCVRLMKGDFAQQTQYHANPIEVAQDFINQGANWLHVVDLDAAKDPQQKQTQVIRDLLKANSVSLQLGGGIRDVAQIKEWLDLGVQRVIIGSQAVNNPSLVRDWLKAFGAEQIVLALDTRINEQNIAYVAAHGWQKLTQHKLMDLLDYYHTVNLRHLLCTDIDRDGTLQGPNTDLYQQLLQKFPKLQLQASGGIASLSDLQQLQKQQLPGAVIGRALYENKFTLREALQC